MSIATARAHTNIALVKYWGKRDERLFLPMNGSLSLTLDALFTTTTVAFDPALAADAFFLDGEAQSGRALAQVTAFLDLVRAQAGTAARARVSSKNDVPTAAGLASSASGFAALAAASSKAAGLDLDPVGLSRLARQGSGSACRSIWGGFVEWRPGERPDGLDCHGVPVEEAPDWPLRMVVTLLTAGPKAVASRDGMRRTVATSPFYPGWLAGVPGDLVAIKAAIVRRDLEALGTVAERSALRMHGTTLGADPPFTYFSPATLAIWEAVRGLRAAGVPAYCTMDAGPNVKVLCEARDEAAVREALAAVPALKGLIACGPGPGVTYLDQTVS